MRLTEIYGSDDEAKRASSADEFKPGWHPARIKEAHERPDKNGEDMIELLLGLPFRGNGEFERRDWLSNNKRGARKLRNCCIACNVLDHYEQQDIQPALFPGKDVLVKLVRSGRFLNIEDYRPLNSTGVGGYFRTAAKSLVLLGGVSALALLGACAGMPDPFNPYPRGQSYYYAAPRPYQRPAYVPPQNYAYRQAPVPPAPSPSWQRDLGVGAVGAGLGVAGGMMASRGGTAAALGEGAEAATVGEAVTAGRALGAARAGAAAVGAAEAAEAAAVAGEVEEGAIIIEILEGLLLL